MLTINTNTSSLFAQNSLSGAQNALATSVQRLSSGLRINNAADDAAGLAISQSLQAQINGINGAIQDLLHATNLAQTADSGLSSIQDMLLNMKQLATQGYDGSLSASQRTDIVTQLQDLNTAINNIAQSTQYNGINLLSYGVSVNAQGAVSSDNPAIATAITTADSVAGTYTVNVTQGTATTLVESGIVNYNDQVNSSVSISIGSTSYQANQINVVNGQSVSAMAKSGLNSDGSTYSTVSDFSNWIGSLASAGAAITSSFVFPTQINPNLSITAGYGGGLHVYKANQSNVLNSTVSAMAKSGGGGTYSTSADMTNWLNALKAAGASISSYYYNPLPLQYNNDFSDIQVKGSALPSDTVSTIPLYGLYQYGLNSTTSGTGTYVVTSNGNTGSQGTGTPGVHVGDVTALDYSGVPSSVDHFLITSSGSSVTMAAWPASGSSALASTTLTVPATITAGNSFALNFNLGSYGSVKIQVDPIISSSTYPSASTWIASSLYLANKQPGTPGWLTLDNGSGVALQVQGTQAGLANAVSINNLSVSNELTNAAESITTTVEQAATDAQISISSANGGGTFTVGGSSNFNASVSGINFVINPTQTGTAKIQVQGISQSQSVLEFQSGATSNFHVTVNTTNVLTNTNGVAKQMTAIGNDLTIVGSGNLANLSSIDSLQSWQSAFQKFAGDLDTAVDYISTLRSSYGSKVNAINFNSQNLQSQGLTTQSSNSAIVDTNFALETSRLAKGQIMQQASTAVAAQANQEPSVVLGLLDKSFSGNYSIQNFVY
jgi:flagellin